MQGIVFTKLRHLVILRLTRFDYVELAGPRQRGESRYITMVTGAHCVMMTSVTMVIWVPLWLAGSSDSLVAALP